MRFFNTEGPVRVGDHYMIPPLSRLDLDHLCWLVDAKKSFLVHAPRQTGKTSCLMAFAAHLNQHGNHRAVYANIEAAQALREQVGEAIPVIVEEIAAAAREQLADPFPLRHLRGDLAEAPRQALLTRLLSDWAEQSPKPLVLVLDEVDALIGDTLLSVLRQLRAGYPKRPEAFPQSVILCGVRDIRDYRIHSLSLKEKDAVTGGSAFNVRAESLRLGDLTKEEVAALYAQHTADTGQPFASGVLDRVWELTRGQPWLVNALAHEATWNIRDGRDRSRPITLAAINEARENLIMGRVTHIDQLAFQLQQDRVRRIVAPIIEGIDPVLDVDDDDIRYCIDLGLIRRGPDGLEIANPIYREVVPRSLTTTVQIALETSEKTAWYIRPDGSLDLPKLFVHFQQFFREHSESWVERFQYKEAGPQLLLQAFLQRIVNGGGRVEREYGLGRKRTDLLVIWPYSAGTQRAVIELKTGENPPTQGALDAALTQTAEYLDRCGAAEGHLVWFDRARGPWDDKIYDRKITHGSRTIHLWGA